MRDKKNNKEAINKGRQQNVHIRGRNTRNKKLEIRKFFIFLQHFVYEE